MAKRSCSRSSSRSSGEDFLSLQIRAARLPTPLRQYRFDPNRKWTFDFAWPVALLAMEVEGGTWVAGRHTRGAGFARDCEKYNRAAISGWAVLRVTTEMVEDGTALRLLEEACRGSVRG
jgi:very-short-patch-repair endonuclease